MANNLSKTPEVKSPEKTSKSTLFTSLRDLFINGNTTTLKYQEQEIIPINNKGNNTSNGRYGPTSSKAFKDGTTANTILEEALLKSVIRELKNSNLNSYTKYGLSFKRVNGIWIQDTVQIKGDLIANIGTIIMGNVIFENVTLPSFVSDFGNPFDKNHNVPTVTFTGKIY